MKLTGFSVLLAALLLHCQNSPTSQYATEFNEKYGNLDNIEDLILKDDFTALSGWTASQHYYDYRSGHYKSAVSLGMSTTPVLLSGGGVRIFYDGNTNRPATQRGMSGLRSAKLSKFAPGSGRKMVIRFSASLAESTANQYNKIVVTVNQGDDETLFAEESVDAKRCSNETIGNGLAFVLEDDSVNNRILRVERMEGSLPSFATYSVSTCTPNTSYGGTLYAGQSGNTIAFDNNSIAGCDFSTNCDLSGPYKNSGPYPFITRRFTALNPSEYPGAVTDKSTKQMYAQRSITTADLPQATLESYNDHVITVTETGEITWTAYGKSFTFTEFTTSGNTLNFTSGYRFVTVKMQQDGLASDNASLKTRLKSLSVSMK